MSASYPVIIIGASQAGLAMGYVLKSAGMEYLIVGKEKRIGDVWRNRYDSLVLFTPRWMSRLPGFIVRRRSGGPDVYASKNEIADDLEAYAAEYQLNVKLSTEVLRMTRSNDQYWLETNQGTFTARSVVIATGPFQKPYIPDFATGLSQDVFQIHTAHYKNRQQLQKGNVLIVGCGNSGAQIAVELAEHHQVNVSASRPLTFLPQTLLGKSLFWWLDKLGIARAPAHSWIGERIRKRGDPIIGNELKWLLKSQKVVLYPRTLNVRKDQVTFENGEQLQVSNIIWATGFTADYSWVHVPNVLDEHKRPCHVRGVTHAEGVYFLGLPWQSNRSSALIGGVAADAQYVLKHMIART